MFLSKEYTVTKEIKSSGDSEIYVVPHEIVCDTTRKAEKPELIHVVSRIISCTVHSIYESPLYVYSMSFLNV